MDGGDRRPPARPVMTPEQWAVIGPVLAGQRQQLHGRVMQLEDQVMDLNAHIALCNRQLADAHARIAGLEAQLENALLRRRSITNKAG